MIDSLIFGIILSGTLLISEPNEKGRKAANNIIIATYYQNEYDKVINPIINNVERMYIPDDLKKLGLGASLFYRLTIDNKVDYSWSF